MCKQMFLNGLCAGVLDRSCAVVICRQAVRRRVSVVSDRSVGLMYEQHAYESG